MKAVPNAEELYIGNHFIQTYSGNRFEIEAPVFDVRDIAHALSLVCRFGGHSSEFYSVAEHSILVHDLMASLYPVADPIEGLLHDASEAYIGDLPSPFKGLMPSFQFFEQKLDTAIRKKFSLRPKRSNAEKHCDLLAVYIEAKVLMKDGGLCFENVNNYKEQADKLSEFHPIRCLTPMEAEIEFLKLTNHYGLNHV